MSKKKYSQKDVSLETLLDLDGEIFPMDNGYWTKFEANKVEPTKQIPHGIRYSLTLHDRNNNRILGSTTRMLTKLKKRNMEHAKLLGITNIRPKRFIATNSNQQASFLKIFGKLLIEF